VIPGFNRSTRALSVSTKKLIAELSARAYVPVKGGKGSHIKLKATPTGRPIILPANRESLSLGVLATAGEALAP